MQVLTTGGMPPLPVPGSLASLHSLTSVRSAPIDGAVVAPLSTLMRHASQA